MSEQSNQPAGAMVESPSELVSRYLHEHAVAHEIVEHEERFTAAAEARAADVEPQDAAKAVLLRGEQGYLLAVIPASHRLDLHKVRSVGRDPKLELASESELAVAFPRMQLGALPPIGPDPGIREVLDPRLLEHERILCGAGDHRHSVLLDPQELVRVREPTVADVCED